MLVAPLVRIEGPSVSGLNLTIKLNSDVFTLLTLDMAAIASRRLTRRIGHLLDYEYEIRRALDRLFTGF